MPFCFLNFEEVNWPDACGVTPLLAAARRDEGAAPVVARLLRARAAPNGCGPPPGRARDEPVLKRLARATTE